MAVTPLILIDDQVPVLMDIWTRQTTKPVCIEKERRGVVEGRMGGYCALDGFMRMALAYRRVASIS